jgi:hypothetical protein
VPPDPPAADRPPLGRGELRARIVRGTVVNAAALGAIDLLVLAQGLIVTRLLGPPAIGVYLEFCSARAPAVVLGPLLGLVLWRGIGDRALALAAGVLLAVAVPAA